MAAASAEAKPTVELPDVKPAKLGKPIVFGPEKPEAAVIWLHGFGDKPDGWAQLLRPLRRAASQKIRWLHLRAPPVVQPAYGNRALPGWGPFYDSKCVRVGSKDHEEKDEKGLVAAFVLAVHAEIGKLVAEGVAAERVVLAGFSQGAAVALEAALCYGGRLAGCIVLSGWATPRARAAIPVRKHSDMPILVGHGTKDDMVHVGCGEAVAEALRPSGGTAVQLQTFKGMAHASCSQEMKLVANFVHSATRCADAPSGAELKVAEWERGGPCAGSDDEEDASEDGPALGYVSKRALDSLKELLSKGSEISEAQIKALTDVADLPADDAMAPLSYDKLFSEAGDTGDIEDVDEAVEKLGAKRVAELFVAAAAAPEAQAAEAMTAEQWRTIQMASDSDAVV